MSKASDAGKSFLAGVIAKLPEAVRGQVQAAFESAEATASLEVIGTGTLAQPEISRQLDELRTQRDSLQTLRDSNETWYAENKAALEDYLKIKPEFDTLKKNPPDPAKPVPADGLTKEEIAAALESRDRAFAGAMALGLNLTAKHLHMFNEPLDITELLSDPKVGTVLDKNTGRVYGLQDAYDAKHGERLRTKATEAEAARIGKLVDEGVRERMKGIQQPFPIRDSSPSPLDALNAADRKIDSFTVDSAVAKYEELSQSRSQSGA